MTHSDPLLQNATGRLCRFLEYTHSPHNGGNMTLRQLWSNYLHAADGADLHVKLGSIVQLPAEAEAEMRDLRDSPFPLDDLLAALPIASQALHFAGNLDQSIDHARTLYDNGTLTTLRFASMQIAKEMKPRTVTDEELDEIRVSAQEFLDLVNETNSIDSDLRKVLLEHTYAILKAVDLFKISGSKTLEHELDRLHGHVYRSMNLFAPVVKTSGPMKDKFTRMVLALGAVSTILSAPLSIAESVGEYNALITSDAPTSVIAPPEHGVPAEPV